MKNKKMFYIIGLLIVTIVIIAGVSSQGALFSGRAGGGVSGENSSLALTKLDYQLSYSTASISSASQGIQLYGNTPAGFNAKRGFLYINGIQVNADTSIYSIDAMTRLSSKNQWTLVTGGPTTFITYVISPSELLAKVADQLTLPLSKITIKFCDNNSICYSQDYNYLNPSFVTVAGY